MTRRFRGRPNSWCLELWPTVCLSNKSKWWRLERAVTWVGQNASFQSLITTLNRLHMRTTPSCSNSCLRRLKFDATWQPHGGSYTPTQCWTGYLIRHLRIRTSILVGPMTGRNWRRSIRSLLTFNQYLTHYVRWSMFPVYTVNTQAWSQHDRSDCWKIVLCRWHGLYFSIRLIMVVNPNVAQPV